MPEQQQPEMSPTVVWRTLPEWQERRLARGFQALRELFGGEPTARARALVQQDLFGESVAIPPRAAG